MLAAVAVALVSQVLLDPVQQVVMAAWEVLLVLMADLVPAVAVAEAVVHHQ
jgi:hypothetical protein